jgi:hypothetical protein
LLHNNSCKSVNQTVYFIYLIFNIFFNKPFTPLEDGAAEEEGTEREEAGAGREAKRASGGGAKKESETPLNIDG